MTRAEIESGLRRIVSEVGAVAKNILAGESRTVAAAVALHALITGDHERRLRVLEPCRCTTTGDRPHHFVADVCEFCGVSR